MAVLNVMGSCHCDLEYGNDHEMSTTGLKVVRRVNTQIPSDRSNSHLGSPGFESEPGGWLPGLKFSWFSSLTPCK